MLFVLLPLLFTAFSLQAMHSSMSSPPSLYTLCVIHLEKVITSHTPDQRSTFIAKLDALPVDIKQRIRSYYGQKYKQVLFNHQAPTPSVRAFSAAVLPHPTLFTCVSFVPHTSFIALGGADGTFFIFDIHHLDRVKELTGHTAAITCLTVSRCGTYALTGSKDNTVRFWDLTTSMCKGVLTGHQASIEAVAFASTNNNSAPSVGAQAYSYTRDNRLYNWDLTTSQPIRTKNLVPSLQSYGVTQPCIHATFNDNAENLAIACTSTSNPLYTVCVLMFNVAQNSTYAIKRLRGATPCAIRLQSDTSGYLADTISAPPLIESGFLTCFDFKTSTLNGFTLPIYGSDRPSCLAVNPTGSHALVGSTNSTIYLCDITSKKVITPLCAHTGTVVSAAFNSAGNYALSIDNKGIVCLWDLTVHLEQLSMHRLWSIIAPPVDRSTCTLS